MKKFLSGLLLGSLVTSISMVFADWPNDEWKYNPGPTPSQQNMQRQLNQLENDSYKQYYEPKRPC